VGKDLTVPVTAMADGADFIWCGTTDGLVKIQKATGAVTHYTKTNSGLPSNEVTAVALDRNGSIWVGTRDPLWAGLARFDGTRWVVYNTGNSGLPSDNITSLAFDKTGGLWVGTESGLVRLVGGRWTVPASKKDSLSSSHITSLLVDGSGSLWAVIKPNTESGKILLRLDPGGGVKVFEAEESSMPGYVTCMATGGQNEVWLGFSAGGVVRINRNQWKVFAPGSQGLPFSSVSALAVSSTGEVWAGSERDPFSSKTRGGLARFSNGVWSSFQPPTGGHFSRSIAALLVDSAGSLWIGTHSELASGTNRSNGCLARYTQGRFETFPDFPKAPARALSVQALGPDGRGGTWVGTGGGLGFWGPEGWKTYKHGDSKLPSDNVTALAIDETSSTLWIGTEEFIPKSDKRGQGAIASLRETNWKVYDHKATGLASLECRGLVLDRRGHLLAGFTRLYTTQAVYDQRRSSRTGVRPFKEFKSDFEGGGLALFDGHHWAPIEAALPSQEVRAITLDAQGRLWVGTNSGLALVEGPKVRVFTAASGNLPADFITGLAPGPRGELWVATPAGLARFDGSRWQTFTRNNSPIPSDWIQAVHVDNQGTVWLGLRYGGLTSFNGSVWKTFTSSNSGLPHDDVLALGSDRRGAIWVGAGYWNEDDGKGYCLSRFEGGQWTKIAPPDFQKDRAGGASWWRRLFNW
jgi:ligand-binding sensor domain-containing protein